VARSTCASTTRGAAITMARIETVRNRFIMRYSRNCRTSCYECWRC